VVENTTTTMMWISGVRPGAVFEAVIASGLALAISGYFAAKQQHAYSPILAHSHERIHADWGRLFVVVLILVFAMATTRHGLGALTVSAIGVVFGDIGSSPLYALKEIPAESGGLRCKKCGRTYWRNCIGCDRPPVHIFKKRQAMLSSATRT
jgi:hypothetical protein